MNNKVAFIRDFLLEFFPDGIQMFNSKNNAGDYMIDIFDELDVRIKFAPHYEYVEVFGLTNEEFAELDKAVNARFPC